MPKPAILLALALLVPAASAQSVVAYSQSYISPATAWGGLWDEDDRGNRYASTNLDGNAGRTSAWAGGDVGAMHARAELTVPAVQRAEAFARLNVKDSLNVVSAGRTGRGTLALKYHLSGGVGVSAAQYDPNRSWWAEATCTSVIYVNGWLTDTRELARKEGTYFPGSYYHDQFGERTLEIGFDFSQPINLETVVSASAYFENASGFAVADFGSTFRWTGVAGVYDEAGAAITDYSVKGASGLDYANPQAVPEPASLLALGVGAAGLLRRRMRWA